MVKDENEPPLLHPEGMTETYEEHPTPERRWDVLETCRLDPDRPLSPGYQRLSSRKISRTDPDATPMSVRYGGTALGYQDHYLIDGGKARIIPGTRLRVSFVTPGDVMENQPFRDQLRRTVFRYQLRPRRVIADTTYGTVENLLALEEDGITPSSHYQNGRSPRRSIDQTASATTLTGMSTSVRRVRSSRCGGPTRSGSGSSTERIQRSARAARFGSTARPTAVVGSSTVPSTPSCWNG